MKKIGALMLALLLAFSLSTVAAPAPAQAETQIPGIDVSRYQGDIDWPAVAGSGVQFAMLRIVCQGSDNLEDVKFEDNYAGATQNNIKVGAYLYSDATTVDEASVEADACLQYLGGRHLDYPIAFDVENSSQYSLSSDTLGDIVQAFCSKIQNAGYTPMVYSNKNFFQNHLTSPLARQYDIWVAQYADQAAPDFQGQSMWQYSSSGSVPGISGRCDLDYSYVDYAAGGNGGGTSTDITDPLTFLCDTSAYQFGDNLHYTYKITTADTYPPTATSSNPSAVTVSAAKAVYQGFLFTLTNVGKGDAVITTKAGDGRSVSFPVTGTGTASTLRCDTSSYAFSTNTSYIYKITTNASTAPTARSSDSSVVSVSYLERTAGGYLYRIKNVGTGTATITTTAADGSSVSFPATGNASPASTALWCDTSSYTFGSNTSYIYLIQTDASTAPEARSSDSSVVSVSYLKRTAGGYLYQIKNAGTGTATITTTAADGSSVSFPARGNVSSPKQTGEIQSDTPYYFNMKKGSYYQFKFTGTAGISYRFSCAGNSVLQSVALKQEDGNYYFKVYAAETGCVGVYASWDGGSQRAAIVTVQ